MPKHPMVEVPKKVTNLEHLLYLYPPQQVSSDGILASPPPAPPREQTNGPSKAQRVRHSSRTNTAILRRRLAYKLQIVSWAQIEFQSDICRAVLMQAAST